MREYRTILIDPPWPENGGGKIKRGADRHYPTMSVSDCQRTILMAKPYQPAENAHLYLWSTSNYLMHVRGMMDFIGFRYVACIPWDKQIAGLGQYFRTQAEFLCFGVRGKGMCSSVRTESNGVVGMISEKRTKHSRKPEAAYALIESRSRGPYLEMFARRQRIGWDSWGNEL